MREVIFRGKRIDKLNNEKWICGYLIKEPDGSYWLDQYPNGIRNTANVIPDSIGQFMGFRDINKVDIYEGDILKDRYNRIMLVEWRNCGFGFKAITETNFTYAPDIYHWFEYMDQGRGIVLDGAQPPLIIGNRYENPKLLNGRSTS